jgi:hypothetical protein
MGQLIKCPQSTADGTWILYNTLIDTKEMTTQELFEIITKIIAEPHNVITEHDKRRAIQVFLGFDDYLIDMVPGYCEEGCEIDFGAYAAGVIDELEGK